MCIELILFVDPILPASTAMHWRGRPEILLILPYSYAAGGVGGWGFGVGGGFGAGSGRGGPGFGSGVGTGILNRNFVSLLSV